MLLPVVDAIFADDDFAVTWTMNLDTRIVGLDARRRAVAEEKRAAAVAQDLACASVISRIKAESFRGRACLDERLDYAVRRPRFGASGFQHERDA